MIERLVIRTLDLRRIGEPTADELNDFGTQPSTRAQRSRELGVLKTFDEKTIAPLDLLILREKQDVLRDRRIVRDLPTLVVGQRFQKPFRGMGPNVDEKETLAQRLDVELVDVFGRDEAFEAVGCHYETKRAYELSVGETTIKAHVSEILRKLRVSSRTQAVIEVAKTDFEVIVANTKDRGEEQP